MRWPTAKFSLGAVVYPKLAAERENARMVTGYLIRSGCPIVYLVSDPEGDEKERLETELTDEVNYQFSGDGEESGGGK